MANGVLSDEDKLYLLAQQLLGNPFTGHVVMGLFTGAPVVDHTATLASIAAHELALAGYARQPLSGWSAPSLTADFHAISTAALTTFSNSSLSASTLITGFFYADTLNAKLILAGLFQNPFEILAGSTFETSPFLELTGG